MTSSIPGLFEVGTNDIGTTTLGTWLSSSVQEDGYCSFAADQFQPLEEISSIPPLPDMTFCMNSTGNLAFFDTEGLDYQTELGDNYDIVTVLPHVLVAETVFLVVREQLNPNEGHVKFLSNIFFSLFYRYMHISIVFISKNEIHFTQLK